MTSDQVSDVVTQFVSITGSSTDQARFFVDSAGGNLDTALSTYFETVGTTNPGAHTAPSVSSAPIAPTGPTTLSGEAADEMPAEWKRPSSGSQKSSNRKPPRSGGIKTFSDLSGSSAPASSSRVRGISTLKDINSAAGMSGGGDMSEDEDEEDEGPTDLYAGGGRSGLNVQDPNQQNSGKAGGIVADILKKAKDAGNAPPLSTDNATTSKPTPFFKGPAQTLGSDQVPSRPIVPPTAPGPARQKAFHTALPVPGHFGSDIDDDEDENDEEEEVEKHLTFWKDGFSIEDGPLMSYDDPKNKEILDAINRGRAPLDLLGVRLNQRVTMRVQKRLTENYIPPPKPPSKPFGGTGNRLGSPLPANVRSAELPPLAAEAANTHTSVQHSIIFEVDNTLPITSVQIRLSDGSRMVTRFNHTHTIGDIRRHIALSNPALATRPYALQTTFPSRDLTDDNQTIKEAGVLGAVVIQRYL
ncbi:hypothetical protein PtA15_3A20 [Puccinia triticina]|uniref:UBX domain-containing protein n=1 Tax=Puccinia triticina TaxID=208348 RepID=A0ABY7CDX1_9BASI|nr:uncharacterized protein PtA15_3A20 [Puccinia triticina]WAQ82657.1 hypothetical protein PtA15_3A20 [Puccinia triticina]